MFVFILYGAVKLSGSVGRCVAARTCGTLDQMCHVLLERREGPRMDLDLNSRMVCEFLSSIGRRAAA